MKKLPNFWQVEIENICQNLYTNNTIKSREPADIFDAGVRLFFIKLFSKILGDETPSEKLMKIFYSEDIFEIMINSKYLLEDIIIQDIINPEYAGMIYGELLNCKLDINTTSVKLIAKGKRRSLGAYYTPPVIVKYIVETSIEEKCKNLSFDEILDLKICDPAMGTGRFLISAVEKLTSKLSFLNNNPKVTKEDLYHKVIKNCVFGIDKDPIALAITKAYFHTSFNIKLSELDNIICADTLLDTLPNNFNFDIVIGNPPWQSFGLRNAKAMDSMEQNVLKERYPDSAEYKISLYAVFMEKALRLTKTDGINSFIVPDSWLSGKFFYKIRKYLLEKSTFLEIVLILDDFWKGLNVGRSTIYFLKKVNNKTKLSINALNIKNIENLKLPYKKYTQLSIDLISKREKNRIVLYPDKDSKKVVEIMESHDGKLKDHVIFYSGLIGKKGKNSIVFTDVESIKCNEQRGMLIESGRNFSKNSLVYNGAYILHDKKLFKSGYKVEKYLAPKIFINQTGFELKAYLDENGFFCLNNIHICNAIDDTTNLKFVVALLNSEIMNYYYKVMSMEHGRILAQTDIDFLNELPFPEDKSIPEQIISLIEKHQITDCVIHSKDNVEYSLNIPKNIEIEIEKLLRNWYEVSI